MRRGFTLIELLICIAIIVIIATIVIENVKGNKTVNDNGTIAPTEQPHSKPIKDSGKIQVEKQ